MKIFVTYSTPSYFKARSLAARMAKKKGKFDKIVLYSSDDIDINFRKKNARILEYKKGAGLWLWKPYSIYKALCEEAEYGDYVFYCDAASFFIRNCEHIIRTMNDQDIWVSDNSFIEENYTKEDAFHILNCTGNEYRKTNQIQAYFLCAKKTKKSIAFIKEWLDSASNFDLMNPNNTKYNFKNCSTFVEHRFDQSILSLLVKKYKIHPHLSPLYNHYPIKNRPYFMRNGELVKKGEYPCCIVLQHSPNVDKLYSLISIIKVYSPKIFFNFLWWIKMHLSK